MAECYIISQKKKYINVPTFMQNKNFVNDFNLTLIYHYFNFYKTFVSKLNDIEDVLIKMQ